MSLATTTLNYLVAFVCMALVDYCYGRYTIAASTLQAARAAHWGSVLIVLNAFVVQAYVADPWAIIGVAAGAWIGTYISVRRG